MKESPSLEEPPTPTRPWTLVLATIMESILFLGCVAIAIYLFLRSSVAAAVVAVVGVIALVSAAGLFRRSKVGWWTALISNLLLATALFWDAFSEHYIDVAEIVAGTGFVLLTALLLIGPTRRSIFRSVGRSQPESLKTQ